LRFEGKVLAKRERSCQAFFTGLFFAIKKSIIEELLLAE